MKLSQLYKAFDGADKPFRGDPEVTGITLDSRRVRPGYIFIALPGSGTDGFKFVSDAVARGAVAVVSEHSTGVPSPAVCLTVPDIRSAAGKLAAVYYGNPSAKLKVSGITGTNGKTTTAYLLRAMLECGGMPAGMIGTIEYSIGARNIPAVRTTPDVITVNQLLDEMRRSGCEAAVMEVSSHALDQHRVSGICFNTAIFTNLSRDHMDYHRDRASYLKAKRQLFEIMACLKSGTAVINQDDSACDALIAGLDLKPLYYRCEEPADVYAQNIKVGNEGSVFDLVTPWGKAQINTTLAGRFNVYNILAAAGAAGVQGVSFDCICKVAQWGVQVPGRMQQVETGHEYKVFVDYAHTDDALEKVLIALREITPGRVIAVFGCGGNRDRGKRPAMGRVAAERADYSIVTSDNPRKEDPVAIIEEITVGMSGASYSVEPDRAKAIALALETAQPGDTVLIAGKGHERFQELAHTTIPFDDVQVVRAICGKA